MADNLPHSPVGRETKFYQNIIKPQLCFTDLRAKSAEGGGGGRCSLGPPGKDISPLQCVLWMQHRLAFGGESTGESLPQNPVKYVLVVVWLAPVLKSPGGSVSLPAPGLHAEAASQLDGTNHARSFLESEIDSVATSVALRDSCFTCEASPVVKS